MLFITILSGLDYLHPWIQNVAELRQNNCSEKLLELSEPHFHAVMAVIWNEIAIFYSTITETEIEIASETAF